MKSKITTLVFMITMIVAMSGCNEADTQPGDPCSVEISGVQFTRSLNGAEKNTTRENDRIRIRSDAKKDYFNDPNGELSNSTAPALLTKVDNLKPFTMTVKVTPEFTATYDAGAIYVYSSDQLWQKFAFEKDEQDRTRIVSVRTIKTSDDNNHDIVTGESAYLKVSSDTKTIGFYYSTDNTAWNLARLYKNDFPATIWLGLSSQSPVGNGNATYFEGLSLTKESVANFRIGM